MNDIIHQVEEELRSGAILNSPHICAEYRARLSGEYSFWAGQLEQILKDKPALWNAHRKDFKSDSACDKWWEATQEGINETGIILKMKRMDKLMSGLNGLIKIAEAQAHNNY